MKLWCTACHTCWVEAVLNVFDKCPFKDCPGHLSAVAPPKPKRIRHKRDKSLPLFEDVKA